MRKAIGCRCGERGGYGICFSLLSEVSMYVAFTRYLTSFHSVLQSRHAEITKSTSYLKPLLQTATIK